MNSIPFLLLVEVNPWLIFHSRVLMEDDLASPLLNYRNTTENDVPIAPVVHTSYFACIILLGHA